LLSIVCAGSPPKWRCLDHVAPLAHMGRNSYRNLVSCCAKRIKAMAVAKAEA
jgi:hypothetical protein